jgi:hypothetical protein
MSSLQRGQLRMSKDNSSSFPTSADSQAFKQEAAHHIILQISKTPLGIVVVVTPTAMIFTCRGERVLHWNSKDPTTRPRRREAKLKILKQP